MSEDYDPAVRPSRAVWRDWPDIQAYLAREEAARERRERLGREYRAAQIAGCAHGRIRRVYGADPDLRPGLECRAGRCGVVYLTLAEVLDEWKASQPDEASETVTTTATPEPEPSLRRWWQRFRNRA
jgi:hypothetical protein